LTSSTRSDRTSSPSDGATSSDEPTGTAQSPSEREGDPSGSTGLSTGAKAGIAVGVVFLVLACFLVAFFLLRRRKKSRAKKATTPDAVLAAGAVPELSGKETQPLPEMEAGENGNVHPTELDSRTRAELVGDSRHGPTQQHDPLQPWNGSPVYEMDGSRQDLPASGPMLPATSSSPAAEPPSNTQLTSETTTALAPRRGGADGSIHVGQTSRDDTSTVDEYEQLRREEEELESRRRTLEELKEVQERQSHVRERLKGLKHSGRTE